jgi:hypothetical protein
MKMVEFLKLKAMYHNIVVIQVPDMVYNVTFPALIYKRYITDLTFFLKKHPTVLNKFASFIFIFCIVM